MMPLLGKLGALLAAIAAAGAGAAESFRRFHPVAPRQRRRTNYGQSAGKNAMLMRRRDGTMEVVNPARRERKKLGLSGRQARIARKAARREAKERAA